MSSFCVGRAARSTVLARQRDVSRVLWVAEGPRSRVTLAWVFAMLLAVVIVVPGTAQQTAPQSSPQALAPVQTGPPDQPMVVVTEDRLRLRVVPIATGLSHPWGMAFLPDGHGLLVTERPGRLRIIRDGMLDPKPIAGVPVVNPTYLGGLNDVAVHPDFAKNHYVYLSYSKDGPRGVTLALARGQFNGSELTNVVDIFVAEAWEQAGTPTGGGGTFAGRMLFDPNGLLYLTVGDRDARVLGDDPTLRLRAQDLGNHVGKVLRLQDDGTPAKGNPFIGKAGAKPEIYSYGHRNAYGLAFRPDTAELWECEFGPLGGDELNILLPGKNYGWPLISLGRNYTGQPVSEQGWWAPGMEMPVYFWSPSFNPTNILFYTGTRFPSWRRSLIVSGLGSKQVQRLTINQRGAVVGKPISMHGQLGQRFRDVRQGPDGLLYVLTEGRVTGNDDLDGTVLRIEPAEME
jgi:glucose/arabinose dehydrogenase